MEKFLGISSARRTRSGRGVRGESPGETGSVAPQSGGRRASRFSSQSGMPTERRLVALTNGVQLQGPEQREH